MKLSDSQSARACRLLVERCSGGGGDMKNEVESVQRLASRRERANQASEKLDAPHSDSGGGDVAAAAAAAAISRLHVADATAVGEAYGDGRNGHRSRCRWASSTVPIAIR